MPRNKQALIRHRTIDACLRNRQRRWTWHDLAAACGDALRESGSGDTDDPARNTIALDIRDMRSGVLGYRAPIVYDRATQAYRYSDPHFSITGSPINDDDLQTLRYAADLLRQFRQWEAIEGLGDIVGRLEAALHRHGPPAPAPVVHFDQIDGAPWQRWITPLMRAVRERQRLRLDYRPFDPPELLQRALSPYLVKEYNKRWFVIGYDHHDGRVHTFALDRIENVEDDLLYKFYQAPQFVADTWFRHIVGVSLPYEGRPQTIRLRTTHLRACYLRTKPLHPSQTEETPPDAPQPVFSFYLIVNYEWERLLISFADEVEVLEPLSLRTQVQERLQAAARVYE